MSCSVSEVEGAAQSLFKRILLHNPAFHVDRFLDEAQQAVACHIVKIVVEQFVVDRLSVEQPVLQHLGIA